MCGENPDEVFAGKKKDVSRNRTETFDHTVRPLAYLRRRFPSRKAVPERLPVWALSKDLGQTQPSILTVVSFYQVRISFGYGSKTGWSGW